MKKINKLLILSLGLFFQLACNSRAKHYSSYKCGQYKVEISHNLYWEAIKSEGVFFKVYDKVFIWYFCNRLYVITDRVYEGKYFMLHILGKNGSFVNKDFRLLNNKSEDLGFIKGMIVSKVNLDSGFANKRVRIGIYSKRNGINKNIWAKRINMKVVIENELLRYSKEFD